MTERKHIAGAHDSVLLLSGGLDSTALASISRPAICLTINYGQVCATGELRAAQAVANALNLKAITLSLDLAQLGVGLMAGSIMHPDSPSPEWWPFRNQLLATVGAMVAIKHGLNRVIVGTVRGDGDRHVDGTPSFYSRLDQLVAMQEGAVHIEAPAIGYRTEELIESSGLGEDVLGWTISCHRSNFACGDCPGCRKRFQTLRNVGLLSYGDTTFG